MQEETTFTLMIDGQEIIVRYRPRYFAVADYGHFEFRSPLNPPRRIPVSDTGYRSHFSPMHEIGAAPNVEAYAHALALALMRQINRAEDDPEQLALF